MRLSIRTKLVGRAIFILIAIMIVGWRGIEGMRDINEDLNEIKIRQFAPMQIIANTNIGLIAWNRAILNHVLAENFQKMDEYEKIMLEQKAALIERLQQLSQMDRLSKRGKELVLEVLTDFSEADPIRERVVMLSREGKQEEGRYFILTELRPIVDHMDAAITEFLRLQERQLEKTIQATDKRYIQGLTRITLIIGSVIIAVILIFYFFSAALLKNINELVRGAKLASAEDFMQAKTTIMSKDEFEYLSTVFNQMLDSLARSISELEKAKAGLKSLNADLEISNKSLDDFAYTISHDLREPLRGIRSLSSFLQEDYADKLDTKDRSRLKRLMQLTQRMEDLIESVLYFSRLGRQKFAFAKTDLNAVVEEAIDTLKFSLQESGTEIRIPHKLPSIVCDKVRVGELFSNLITNAMKYNDKPEKWIEIGFQADQDPCVFYVRDNGIGIKEKQQEKIFKIFQRLHGRDKYGGGTGAGLTIVKEIIERHEGKIWVKSTFGEGTTFFFTFQGGEQ